MIESVLVDGGIVCYRRKRVDTKVGTARVEGDVFPECCTVDIVAVLDGDGPPSSFPHVIIHIVMVGWVGCAFGGLHTHSFMHKLGDFELPHITETSVEFGENALLFEDDFFL